jgi:Cu/Ag efflux protein CusF
MMKKILHHAKGGDTKMKRNLIAALAILSCCCATTWAASPETGAPASTKPSARAPHYVGRIEAIDIKAGTMTLKNQNANKVFELDKKCEYVGFEKKTTDLSGLKTGEQLRVAYVEKGDKLVATKVERIVTGTAKAAPMPKHE